MAMALVVILAFSLVLSRLWNVQVRKGESYREQSMNNFFQFKRLEHDRGEIADREGRILVTNRPSVNVYVTPAFFPNASRMIRKLAAVVGLSKTEAKELSRTLSKIVSERGPPLLLARELSLADVRALRQKAKKLELPVDALLVLKAPGDTYATYLNPDVFPSRTSVLRYLQDTLHIEKKDMAKLRRRIYNARGLAKYLDIIVRRDVDPLEEGKITLKVELGELPGVTVRRATARDYRYGEMAAHVLGYVNEISGDELEKKKALGYQAGDAVGRRGVERTFEDELRGADGRNTVVVDSKGRAQHTPLAKELQSNVGERKAPQPGHRVVLSLDLDLQKAAEEAFAGQAGAIVLMEAHTGRLLALTSTPSFNPAKLAGYFDPKEKARLDSMRTRRPWRFRAIQDYFAPGSTFKVVTAIAALKAGLMTPKDKVNCPGAFKLGRTKFRCWKDAGHGLVNLHTSLAKSCDVYYYTIGARMGLDAIAEIGFAMGFGKATGIDLSPESNGIMPTKAWYRKRRRAGYTLGAAVNASIGQGAVSVTPIQLAVAYGALANGGKVYKPQIGLRIETYDGQLVRTLRPELISQMEISNEILAEVREGLRQVVNDPSGTAFRKRLKDIQVSGKTGTAQVAKLGKKRVRNSQLPWKLRDHAWFSAMAPAENPEVVVVVFNEHGGGGSSVAAPIAMKVVDAWHKKKLRQQASLSSEPLKIAVSEPETIHHHHHHDHEEIVHVP